MRISSFGPRKRSSSLLVGVCLKWYLTVDFWEASGGAKIIVDAMKELSRRVISNNRTKVVMKLSTFFIMMELNS